jgi:hypothetical protein
VTIGLGAAGVVALLVQLVLVGMGVQVPVFTLAGIPFVLIVAAALIRQRSARPNLDDEA